MTALVDLQDPGLIHGGAAVVIPHRHGGQRHQGVHLRHGGGGPLDPAAVVGDGLPQGGEQLVLQGHHPVRGGEDLMLQVF